MLVGEPPQTRRTSGQIVPKSRRYAPFVCGLSLSLLGLIFSLVCYAEQMIDICLDRHSLPHPLLGLPVFHIESLFLSRQFLAGFFQFVHLRELRPIQKIIYRSLRRPVGGELRFVLGQTLFTVPGRLLAIEHGPGFCIVHYGSHELGGF